MFTRLYNKIAHPIRQHPYIQKHPTAKELIKYTIVGNANNVLDFGLYVFLTRAFNFWHEHYLIANIITMLTAGITRFVCHKKWTFRDSGRAINKQFLKFIITLFLTLFAGDLFLFILVERVAINDVLAKLLSSLLTTLITFRLTSSWVFQEKRNIIK
jgi:putative flippase GtrA